MRAFLLAGLALALGSCGQSPLLKIAASNYSPQLGVGAKWNYVTPSGGPAFERRVVAAGNYFGRDAFQVDTLVPGITLTASVFYSGSVIDQYKASAGAWETVRKLPYLTGNRWELFPGTNVTSTVFVEGTENIVVPAGTYVRCYRLRTEVKTYNPGTGVTTTADSLAWAAPVVGDVQYGTLNPDSSVTVSSMLASYSPGP